MTRLPDIALDPYLLCLPSPCKSAEEVEHFVSRLLAWKRAANKHELRILISQDCIDALTIDNQYPYRHELGRLIQQFGIEFADTGTVAQVAQSLLDRLPPLDEVTGIACTLCGDGYPVVIPDILLARLRPASREAFADALVRLAYHYERVERETDCIIASASFTSEAPEQLDVTIRALIEEIEEYSGGHDVARTLPVMTERTFGRHVDYESVLHNLGPVRIWGDGFSLDAALESIRVKTDELLRADGTQSHARKAARLGSAFLSSVRNSNFPSRPDWLSVLIESCARIIVDEPKNDVKPFRKNESPNAEQRTRSYDGAGAFRTHLTKGSEGWRLMLWKWPDGTIEFANVGTKFELEIEEGEDGQQSQPI